MTCPASPVIQEGHWSSMCWLDLWIQVSKKLGDNEGMNYDGNMGMKWKLKVRVRC